MASPVIQFKRGILSNLPGLRAGEPGFTTDSYDLYVGIDSTTTNNQFVGSGRFWSVGSATTASGVKLVEATDNGTSAVTLKAPDSLSGDVTFTVPGSDGTAGQFVKTDGSGNLSFGTVTSSFTLAADSGSNDTFNTGETLTISGTANEVNTAVSDNTITIGLPDNVTIAGDLTVSGNDIKDSGGSAAITFDGSTNTTVNGDLTVTGTSTLNGDVALGNAGGDTITVVGVATFTTSNVYIDNELFVGGIQIVGTESATQLGDDISTRNLSVSGITTFTGAIDANGGADISGGETTLSSATVSDLTSGRVVLAGTSGALEDSGNLTFDGSTLTVVGYADLDEVNVSSAATIATAVVTNATITNTTFGSGTAITSIDTDLSSVSASDDTLASAKAIKSYVDSQVTAQDLDFAGDSGTGAVDLDSQTFTIAGTANEVNTSASGQTITIGLPDNVTIAGDLTVSGNDIKDSGGNAALTFDGSQNVTANSNLTVSGNLYVNGSTTQVNTSSMTVEDRTIELGLVDGSAPSSATTWDLGVLFNYNSSGAKKAAVAWEGASGRFVFGSQVSDGGGTDNDSPQLTFSSYAAVEIGSLWVNDCAGQSQVINCASGERTLENITVDAGTF